jgi:hypothetical protein
MQAEQETKANELFDMEAPKMMQRMAPQPVVRVEGGVDVTATVSTRGASSQTYSTASNSPPTVSRSGAERQASPLEPVALVDSHRRLSDPASFVSTASLQYSAPPPISRLPSVVHKSSADRPPVSPTSPSPHAQATPRCSPVARGNRLTPIQRVLSGAPPPRGGCDSSFMGAAQQSTFMAGESASLMPDTTAALSDVDADATAVLQARRAEEAAADAAIQEASAVGWVHSDSLMDCTGNGAHNRAMQPQRRASDSVLSESRVSQSSRLPCRMGGFTQPEDLAGIYPMSSAGGVRYVESSEMSEIEDAIAKISSSDFQMNRTFSSKPVKGLRSQSVMGPSNPAAAAGSAPPRPPVATAPTDVPVPPSAKKRPLPPLQPQVPPLTSAPLPPRSTRGLQAMQSQSRQPYNDALHQEVSQDALKPINDALLVLDGTSQQMQASQPQAGPEHEGETFQAPIWRADSLTRRGPMHRSGSLGHPGPQSEGPAAPLPPNMSLGRPSREDFSPRNSVTLRERFSMDPPNSLESRGARVRDTYPPSEPVTPGTPYSIVPPSSNNSGYSAGDSDQLATAASSLVPSSPGGVMPQRNLAPGPLLRSSSAGRPPLQPQSIKRGPLESTPQERRSTGRSAGAAELGNPFKAGSVVHDAVSPVIHDTLMRSMQTVESDAGPSPMFDSATQLLDYGGDVEGSEMIGGFDEETAALGRLGGPSSMQQGKGSYMGQQPPISETALERTVSGDSSLSLPSESYSHDVIHAHRKQPAFAKEPVILVRVLFILCDIVSHGYGPHCALFDTVAFQRF